MPPPGREVQAEWPGSQEANRSGNSKTVLAGVRSDVEDSSCLGFDARELRLNLCAPRVTRSSPTTQAKTCPRPGNFTEVAAKATTVSGSPSRVGSRLILSSRGRGPGEDRGLLGERRVTPANDLGLSCASQDDDRKA